MKTAFALIALIFSFSAYAQQEVIERHVLSCDTGKVAMPTTQVDIYERVGTDLIRLAQTKSDGKTYSATFYGGHWKEYRTVRLDGVDIFDVTLDRQPLFDTEMTRPKYRWVVTKWRDIHHGEIESEIPVSCSIAPTN